MTSDSSQRIQEFLTNLHDRTEEASESGNKLGAAYLACIAGMWANRFNCSSNVLKFSSEWTSRWYFLGFDAFTQAIGQAAALRKQQIEREKQEKLKQKKKK